MRELLYKPLGAWNRAVDGLQFRLQKDSVAVTLFDTAIDTRNLGDRIIMDACESFARQAFPEKEFLHLPVHKLPDGEQLLAQAQTKYKFLCGTNLLTSRVERWWNWQLPPGYRGKRQIRNVLLLGAGWHGYEEDCSEYTKLILKSMLHPAMLHAVRDRYTAEKLRRAGISNVLYTACPSMWGLTPDACRDIPATKGETVITTVTDYRREPEADRRMLEILGCCYKSVLIWPQGAEDEAYLASLPLPGNAKVLPRSLPALKEVLQPGVTDYVGTRLHGGIFALNQGVRSLVIGVDNRALEIGRDTGLPVLPRGELAEGLTNWIEKPEATRLELPADNICRFRQQFTGECL